jgi:hypothetical protein
LMGNWRERILHASADYFVFKCPISCRIWGKKSVSGIPLNYKPDAISIQIYSVIKLYMFRAFSLPIIRGFLL